MFFEQRLKNQKKHLGTLLQPSNQNITYDYTEKSNSAQKQFKNDQINTSNKQKRELSVGLDVIKSTTLQKEPGDSPLIKRKNDLKINKMNF